MAAGGSERQQQERNQISPYSQEFEKLVGVEVDARVQSMSVLFRTGSDDDTRDSERRHQ